MNKLNKDSIAEYERAISITSIDHPNGAPPLQSVLHTGCAGHCGSLRLYTTKSVSWQVNKKYQTTHSEHPCLVLLRRGSR